MAETKLDLKGVIQVDDGDGWTSTPRDFKKIFEPFMNAIKAIRAEYPDHYIGLTYGANADQSSKLFTTQYGFTDTTTPSKADIDTTKLDKVNIPDMLKIMAGGSGQAAVLSNPDVINMFTTNGINKFIIIPFDTMNSTVDKDGNGDIDGYGHKTDCIEFAKKFLALPKSIIIGWRNGKSLQSKITNNTERQNIVPGMDMLYFALGGGVAALTDPNLNHTTKDYIDFLISKWDSESQKFIESKIASVPDLKTKIGTEGDDKTKLGTGKKLDDTDADDDAGKTKALGTDADDADDDAVVTEKKPTGVTAAKIEALNAKLKDVKLSDAGDTEKKTAYGIAQEIFNAFFSGGDKTKQTKEFLTSQVSALHELSIFSNESSKAQLDEITRRIENPAIAKKTEVEEVKDDKTEVKDGAKTKEDLEKAAAAKKRKEEEDAAANKTKEDAAAAGNLSVMTFNTWYLSFDAGESATESATFCGDKCSDNNRKAILDQMAKPGPVIIFLQEFTYKFDTFFQGAGVIINTDGFSSSMKAKASDKTPIPAFRYFTMTHVASSNKFHVYIGQISDSVIATIYSDTLSDGEPADEFFVGNLAAGTLAAGKPTGDKDPKSYDLAYTFSGNKKGLTVDKNPDTPAFGGNRPFIILKLNKGIILNLHAPHNDPFKSKIPSGNVDDFGFNALERFIHNTVFKGGDRAEYTFIVGGDFNADAATSIGRLKNIFEDVNTISRNGNTCCTTKGGLIFTRSVDHIFSTLKFSNYTVYDPKDLEKTKSPNQRYFFSDHLPVYATIPKPPEEEPAAAPGAPTLSWVSLFSSSSKPTSTASDAPLAVAAKTSLSSSSSSSSSAAASSSSSSAAASAQLQESNESVPTEQQQQQQQQQQDASEEVSSSSSSGSNVPQAAVSEEQQQQQQQQQQQNASEEVSSSSSSSGSNVQQQEPQAAVSEGASSASSATLESGASGPNVRPDVLDKVEAASGEAASGAVKSGEVAPLSVPAPAPAVTTSAPSGPITSITIMQ
jgi:hypothetical protein